MKTTQHIPIGVAALTFSALYAVQSAVAQPALPDVGEVLGSGNSLGPAVPGAVSELASSAPVELNGELSPGEGNGGEAGSLPGLEDFSVNLSGEVTGPESVDFELFLSADEQIIAVNNMRFLPDGVPEPEDAVDNLVDSAESAEDTLTQQDPEAIAENVTGNGNGAAEAPEQNAEDAIDELETFTENTADAVESAAEDEPEPGMLLPDENGNGQDLAPEDIAINIAGVVSGPEAVSFDLALSLDEQRVTVNGEEIIPSDNGAGLDDLPLPE